MKKESFLFNHLLHISISRFPLISYQFDTGAFWMYQIRAETEPENHQSGTCKMGPSTDPNAVVDSELRVHNIPNIRVADASMFPIVSNITSIAAIVNGRKAFEYKLLRNFHMLNYDTFFMIDWNEISIKVK